MTILERLLLAWTSAWVLAECITPSINIAGQYQAAIIATFTVAYAHDVPRKLWKKWRVRFK